MSISKQVNSLIRNLQRAGYHGDKLARMLTHVQLDGLLLGRGIIVRGNKNGHVSIRYPFGTATPREISIDSIHMASYIADYDPGTGKVVNVYKDRNPSPRRRTAAG